MKPESTKPESMKLEILHCMRCPHAWATKDKSNVKVCPRCKSPYWNTPRKPIKKKSK